MQAKKMLKVLEETIKAVKVKTNAGQETWLPKSMIHIENDYVVSAREFLNLEDVEVNNLSGLEVVYLGNNEVRIIDGKKEVLRKASYKNTFNKMVFLYKKMDICIPADKIINLSYHIGNGLAFYDESQKNKEKKDKSIVESIKKDIEEEEIKNIDFTKPVKHKEYETIKTCVESNIPVYLYGPAGSGKNHTLMEIAKELELEFYFTNSVQQEFKLTGFIDAGGVYHETEFYKAFKNGGLFFLDEMDASIPEVLVLLNAAIANGYFEFPNGKIFANENFRVVAAGNTIGSGSDELYTGRLVLDQATLDRFVSIEFDYDENIELSLSKGDKELTTFIRNLRAKASNTGVRATFSYRCIIATKKLEGKMELSKILQIAIFKGMDKDTISTLYDANTSNKYYNVMYNLVA